VPRLWGASGSTQLRMINWHFWLATLGIVFYAASMWVAGIMQGLMWREYGADGYLVNSFMPTPWRRMHPDVPAARFRRPALPRRALIMVYNVWMTIAGNLRVEAPMMRTPHDPRRPPDCCRPARPARRMRAREGLLS
jgi:cytochrome c oxidase cbb3-type subunit I